MTEQRFIKEAKLAIKKYDDEFQEYSHFEGHFQIIWMCHLLGNKKAMFIDVEHVGEIYEVTYNNKTDEFYIDKYKKVYNGIVKGLDT